MRWWMMPGKKAMAVDNQLCNDLDLDVIPDGTFMVEWRDSGVGEIEVYGNGLRYNFIDVSPYAQIFQQFLGKVPNLQLNQAKKVQNDLIGQIGSAKQQAPFHYPVASGDYYWDPANPMGNASLASVTQNLVAKTNEIASRLNDQMPALDYMDASIAAQADAADASIVADTNAAVTSIVTQTNSVVTAGNVLAIQTSNATGAIANGVNSGVVGPGNQIFGEMNGAVIPTVDNKINSLGGVVGSGVIVIGGVNTPVAMPGLTTALPVISALSGACAHTSLTPPSITASFASLSYPSVSGTSVSGGGNPWTPVDGVASPAIQWVPVGSSTPVDVTPEEANAIIQGIANRSNDLTGKQNMKTAEVNMLTTVAAVIAYDVTAGW